MPKHQPQPQPQAERVSFWNRVGEGLITTKFAPDTVMRSGQITLPVVGSCYIDGIHGFPQFRGDDKSPIVLQLKTVDGRKPVAQLTMDGRSFKDDRKPREATIVTLGPKRGRETWKAVVTVQHGAQGPYLRLFVPGVASKRAAGHITGRVV
jgi:hypothetical protein